MSSRERRRTRCSLMLFIGISVIGIVSFNIHNLNTLLEYVSSQPLVGKMSSNHGSESKRKVPQLLKKIFSTNLPASMEGEEIITFDTLAKMFYLEAISAKPVHDTNERQKINATAWEEHKFPNGGLFPSDKLLLSELYYNASSVFEYGLGESTYIAAHTGVPRYAGVDSAAEWVSMARETVLIKFKKDNFRFTLADVGTCGSPFDQGPGFWPHKNSSTKILDNSFFWHTSKRGQDVVPGLKNVYLGLNFCTNVMILFVLE